MQDEYESFIGSLFLRTMSRNEYGYSINFEISRLWCEKVGLDALEVYDILSYMGAKANKE